MINTDNDIALFFGFVEDNKDPKGRVRVRIIGHNSQNKGILPTEMLKWFPCARQENALGGVGKSSPPYLEGTMVFGLYLDSDRQEAIVLGSVKGPDDMASGDIAVDSKNSSLASNVPDGRGGEWSQPTTPYAAVYPDNDVLVTKSGHVVEYDDTPGAERISIFHKSGTFEEFHPDGTKVDRIIGNSYEINLSEKRILVGGDWDIFVNGDHRINVAGEVYYKVGGGVTFDTDLVRILGNSEATDHISSNVSGKSHIHSGVQPGNGVSSVPVGATAGFAPTPANTFSLQTEDTGLTPVVISQGLSEGFITPEDVVIAETYVPEVEAVDETPAVDTPAEVQDCGLAVDQNGKVNYSAMLTSNVSLRSVSLGAVVSQYAIKDQVGLTKTQIICNLKNLAENVIEPLLKQYPNAMVTSGFRAGSGTSQHLKGEAIDIQFRGMSNAEYYNVAQWIKTNLPYDQLILEYKNFGTRLPWIHVSLKRSTSQRYQAMTFFNHKRIADGLRNMS